MVVFGTTAVSTAVVLAVFALDLVFTSCLAGLAGAFVGDFLVFSAGALDDCFARSFTGAGVWAR